MLPSPSPLIKALKRTRVSLERRISVLRYGAVAGGILALLLKSDVLYLLTGALLGAVISLLVIVLQRFPKHYRRAVRTHS